MARQRAYRDGMKCQRCGSNWLPKSLSSRRRGKRVSPDRLWISNDLRRRRDSDLPKSVREIRGIELEKRVKVISLVCAGADCSMRCGHTRMPCAVGFVRRNPETRHEPASG